MQVAGGVRLGTPYEEMSGSESSREKLLAGLTLDDVLANQKRPSHSSPPQQHHHHHHLPKSRTLFDIIKEDETIHKKDRRSWKAFKDKLRLKRAGSAWTSSIHIPTSDIPIQNPNSRSFSQFGRRNSVRIPNQTHPDSDTSTQYMAHQVEDLDPTAEGADAPAATRPQFSRKSSTRFSAGDSPDNAPSGGGGTLRPQLSRRNSTTIPSEPYRRGRVVTFRDSFDEDDPDDDHQHEAGRTLSAREAVAAQEAAEAAAAAEAEDSEEGRPQAATMSLMDLLEETDREMGLEGSRYILSDDDDDDFDDGDDDDGDGAMEHTCCVCMVRHKGAAFIPCGHTFCRMCSRELMVAKGNCPLCNNFILEILDIF